MNVLSLFCEKRKTEGSSRRVFSRLQITFEADSSLSLSPSLLFPLFFLLLSPLLFGTTRLSVHLLLFFPLFSLFSPLFIRFISFYSLLLLFSFIQSAYLSNNWKNQDQQKIFVFCLYSTVSWFLEIITGIFLWARLIESENSEFSRPLNLKSDGAEWREIDWHLGDGNFWFNSVFFSPDYKNRNQ